MTMTVNPFKGPLTGGILCAQPAHMVVQVIMLLTSHYTLEYYPPTGNGRIQTGTGTGTETETLMSGLLILILK